MNPSLQRETFRGFTLVELLASLAVVTVLIAVLLPALRFARGSAMSASDLADLRTHASVISMYHRDWRDQYPVSISPQTGSGVLPRAGIEIGYFDQVAFWAIPLLGKYYGSEVLDASFYTSNAARDKESFTIGDNPSYLLGASFLADPAYWKLETRLAPPSQLRAMTAPRVRFPSSKTLFEAVEPRSDPLVAAPDSTAAFADGSASKVRASSINAGVPTGPGFFAPWADGPYPLARMLYTLQGVEGMDVSGR